MFKELKYHQCISVSFAFAGSSRALHYLGQQSMHQGGICYYFAGGSHFLCSNK